MTGLLAALAALAWHAIFFAAIATATWALGALTRKPKD